jgi:hypothetical protein
MVSMLPVPPTWLPKPQHDIGSIWISVEPPPFGTVSFKALL